MSPVIRVCMEFAVVVEGNGDTNDKSIWEGQISVRVEDVTEILLSLTTVTHHCQKRDGIHGRRLVTLDR
jgi:predicted AlkP superfamily phosphohydrolase/phosphomutase